MSLFSISPPRGVDSENASGTENDAKHSCHPLDIQPVWVADSNVSECMSCQASFGLFRRRHHCRACGNIFCASCSSHKSTIPELGYFQPTRVCTLCVQRASSLDTPPHSRKKPAFPRSPAVRRKSTPSQSRLRVPCDLNALATDMSCEKENASCAQGTNTVGKSSAKSHATRWSGRTRITESDQSAPVRLWLPDKAADACSHCGVSFSSHRRHHCRSCQRVFCQACSSCRVSPHRLLLFDKGQESLCRNNAYRGHMEDKLRVCRRCFSRIMSCDSSFGRHGISTDLILAIVQYLGIPSIGRVYGLNAKWHGIMCSDTADKHVWGAMLSFEDLEERSFSIATNQFDNEITRQPNRHLYFFNVGLGRRKILMHAQKAPGFIGREAARYVFMRSVTLNHGLDVSDVAHGLFNYLSKWLVERTQTQKYARDSDFFYEQERAAYSTGTLLNFTKRMAPSTLRVVVEKGGLDLLLNIAGSIRLAAPDVTIESILANTTGALWKLATIDQQKDREFSLFVEKHKCSDQLLQVFRNVLISCKVCNEDSKKYLQLMTNCTGLLAVCCGSSIEMLAALQKQGIVKCLLAKMEKIWIAMNLDGYTQIKMAEKFLRTGCTALQNTMVSSKYQRALQSEFCTGGGVQMLLRILVGTSNIRCGIKAAAVLMNVSEGTGIARDWIFENDLKLLLQDICEGDRSTNSQKWEFCAGTIRNLTIGGAKLERQALDELCILLINKSMSLISMHTGDPNIDGSVHKSLASLCGALCNLSLMANNAAALERHGVRTVLRAMKGISSHSSSSMLYVTQALSNLDHHSGRQLKFS